MWKIVTSKCVKIKMPGCLPSKCTTFVKAVPFYVPTRLQLSLHHHKQQCLNIEEAIETELSSEEQDWSKIIDLARTLEETQKRAEAVDRKKKKLNVAGSVSDILQASAITTLILRPDLRFRGILANETLRDIFPNLEVTLMTLLVVWNILAPCLRMRSYMTGHKQGVFGPAGLALLCSIFFNVVPYMVTMVILGGETPFLIPIGILLNSLVLLLAKSLKDKEFQGWSKTSKATYLVCGLLFNVTLQNGERKSKARF